MQTIEELLELADEQEPMEGGIPFLEQAVRMADAQQDREQAFTARMKLVQAATFSGFPDKAMIHFIWLLGTFDRHPTQFRHQTYMVMWMYKWILSSALDNPAFPLERLRKLEADFERRTQQQGYGAHYRAYHALMVAKQRGDEEGAQRAFLAWRSLPRDHISDCEACEQNKIMHYYVWRGNPAAAVKLGQQIIDKGMSCHNVPTVTHANLLLPLLALGQDDEARHAHTEGLRLARLNRHFIDTIAEHLRYLLVTGQQETALDIWAEHLDLALGIHNHADLFEFLSISAALWQSLPAAERPALMLPRRFALYQNSGRYDPAMLARHFQAEAAALASRFDARNGTGRFSSRLSETLALGRMQA